MTLIPYPQDSAAPTPWSGIRRFSLIGAVLVAVFVVGFGIWAAVAPLGSAVLASGVVAPETRRKTIQHLEGGIISAILVRDGQEVVAGTPLIRLDPTRARATVMGLEGQLWDALAQQARLMAERDGREDIAFPDTLAARAGDPAVAGAIQGQERVFETRRNLRRSQADLVRQLTAQTREEITGLEALVRALDTRIAIIQEQIDAIAPLVRQGLERRPRILALQETMAEMDGERAETRAHIARARQTIAESEVSLLAQENDWRNGVAQDLARVQQVVHDLQERLRAAADVLDRTEVRAPEAGVVNDLRVHTVGGVVAPGEALLDLVPKEDRLLVEVQVRPEDIDNLHVGLAAEVSLLPFNHRRVPPVAGQVIYVSADRLSDRATGQPYYVARIRLDEDSLKAAGNLELVPGMPGDAQIHTGETTVALYALSPLLDNFHKAFRAH